MYAVAFDLDIESLKKSYHVPSYENAWGDIRKFMESKGFQWQQRSLYFGGETVNAVTCVITIVELSKKFPWLSKSVKDIRMLRIDEFNDLMAAVHQGAEVHETVEHATN